ncbi:3-hydroxy-9,10-secoandrosta-1,3,5(10)-triene-9, 17-dione monooxygenase reductase component [Thermoflexales bacterium]|nr:3-hydroxy-9,10-secoandrosta-1,3,5(10)-triene-9, 17-dione monooxygenase reductase component [Thermoflexales bacterium]
MSIPIDQFKHVMRQWISGVSIVTMQSAEHRHGLTVSGFLGVSLEPPLVLISIGQELTSAAVLKDSAAYVVNFLREDQHELSNRFAGRLGEVDRFAGLNTHQAVTGAPILDDCLAWLDCRVVSTQVVGDHTLYIGEVMAAGVNGSGKPLLYWNADYRQIDNA